MTYKDIIDHLTHNENFSFSRFGDGEFNAILGSTNKSNCDKHKYFKDLGLRLAQIIESKPDYIMGLQPLVQRTRENDPDFAWLIADQEWCDADVLHKASIHGELNSFFEALLKRNIIFVANINRLEVIPKFSNGTKSFKHIIISDVDCWIEYADVLDCLKRTITTNVVILYAASMMSEVLIDDIYKLYGDSVTQIDVGSLFDPYAGAITRSYHKNLKI